MYVGKTSSAGHASSTTLAPPTGSAAGDTFLAVILIDDPTATITPPGDWALISQQSDVASRFEIYAIVDPAPASYAFTFSTTVWFAAYVVAYRGIVGSVEASAANRAGPVGEPAALAVGGAAWGGSGDLPLLHYAWGLNNNGGRLNVDAPSITLDAALTDRGEYHATGGGEWHMALAASDEAWPSGPTTPTRTSTWAISGGAFTVEVYAFAVAVGVFAPAGYGWGVIV